MIDRIAEDSIIRSNYANRRNRFNSTLRMLWFSSLVYLNYVTEMRDVTLSSVINIAMWVWVCLWLDDHENAEWCHFLKF